MSKNFASGEIANHTEIDMSLPTGRNPLLYEIFKGNLSHDVYSTRHGPVAVLPGNF
jgi:hypothetical protein